MYGSESYFEMYLDELKQKSDTLHLKCRDFFTVVEVQRRQEWAVQGEGVKWNVCFN